MTTTDLTPSQAQQANACMGCGGPLRDAQGVFYQRVESYGRNSARVIFVCRKCRDAL